MELGPRDRLSQAFVHEVEKGRTIDSPYGPVVHLDLRHLGEKVIDAKLPMVRELCRDYERIDPVRELVPVRPVVHYMMGGVHTDIDGATGVPGLYAAGETACVSINGANRLGSNSLPECLVFGARAGRAAAVHAAEAADPGSAVEAQGDDERRRLDDDLLRRGGGPDRISAIRRQMQQILEDAAGIYRDGDTLDQGRRQAARAQGARDDRRHRRHQPPVQHRAGGRPRAHRHAGAGRVHRPQRPAARGVARRPPAHRLPRARRPTVPRPLAGAPRAATARRGCPYLPVTITRWPPGKRVYGR